MRGGTLFSGIGAPELAAPWIDWRWCAEIDPFASAVLKTRFPNTINHGDVVKFPNDAEPVDIVVFGSPCQSFSVAGKRLGLDDPRGNMALVGLQIVRRIRPRWVVFENVPGLLSSDGGRDFGTFLGLLGQCGYGFAYRILDAQFAGVPQRRRRVFVVGHLGDWRPAAAVLFEPESLRGDPPPRREAGEGVAPLLEVGARTGVSTDDPRAGIGIGEAGDPMFTLQNGKQHGIAGHFEQNSMGGRGTLGWNVGDQPLRPIKPQSDHQMIVAPTLPARKTAGGGMGTDFDCDGGLIAYGGNTGGGPAIMQACMTPGTERTPAVAYSIRSDAMREGTALTPSADAEGRVRLHDPGLGIYEGIAPTVEAGAAHAIAFHENQRNEVISSEVAWSLSEGGGKPGQGYPAIASQMSVRRLLPVECERLQGFPDNFTAIAYRGKPAADGPRYRALGNAMAVPVIGWILRRIRLLEECRRAKAA